MEKDFDRWNAKKKQVHAIEHGREFYYHEREIWWCSLGLNVGVEADGKHESFERPVLILKKFNQKMFWGIPLTTQGEERYWLFPITGGQQPSWAILTQLRTFSSNRLLNKDGVIPLDQFKRIKKRIIKLLIREPPHLNDEEAREAEAV